MEQVYLDNLNQVDSFFPGPGKKEYEVDLAGTPLMPYVQLQSTEYLFF